jgi:hypothetical protein
MKNCTLKLRHLGLMAALIFLAGSIRAQSGLNVIFNELAKNNKMTTVTISKEMLSTFLIRPPMAQNSSQRDELEKMANDLGNMRVFSCEQLTPEEQVEYNKMITGFLNGNGGYKDYMSVSSKEKGKETTVRMCVKNIDKDYISEFIIFVSEGPKLSLIAITGKINVSKIMELTQLSNMKDMIIGSMGGNF